MTTSRCRSCHAEIVWALTKRRAKMPLDANPVFPVEYSGSLSNVYTVLARPGGGDPLTLNLNDISDGLQLWRDGELAGRLSHFATCPDSAEHRKPHEPGREIATRPAA